MSIMLKLRNHDLSESWPDRSCFVFKHILNVNDMLSSKDECHFFRCSVQTTDLKPDSCLVLLRNCVPLCISVEVCSGCWSCVFFPGRHPFLIIPILSLIGTRRLVSRKERESGGVRSCRETCCFPRPTFSTAACLSFSQNLTQILKFDFDLMILEGVRSRYDLPSQSPKKHLSFLFTSLPIIPTHGTFFSNVMTMLNFLLLGTS